MTAIILRAPFNAVHGPNEAPSELIRKYRALVEKQPGNLAPSKKEFLAVKYAMLESMDMAIGRMLKALAAKGVLDDTLLVFFNDNGGRLDNPPYQGGKGDTFEGGVRVSCIFRWPGKVPANSSVDGMTHVVDLYPTLIRQTGGSLEQTLPLDGMDMWDTITTGKESPRSEVVHSLQGEHSDTGEMSIRPPGWRPISKPSRPRRRNGNERKNNASQQGNDLNWFYEVQPQMDTDVRIDWLLRSTTTAQQSVSQIQLL